MPAIIGLPFVVVEQEYPVERAIPVQNFSKKPGYQPGFLVSAISISTQLNSQLLAIARR
ncbi:hypothetical protein [Pseudomonas coronafaciens]|uniref:hypothetical protein n=1 Tax=Pseudomonas coronafaciens TaxID=53409 RepID=UPI0012D77DEF|nr:hypothetical protein [Pseudomonas coronafaciens]